MVLTAPIVSYSTRRLMVFQACVNQFPNFFYAEFATCARNLANSSFIEVRLTDVMLNIIDSASNERPTLLVAYLLNLTTLIRRSAGSIGARSAPSTPLQAAPDGPQAAGQQSISGSQLTVAGAGYPQPPRSPSHAALRCNDR